MSDDLSIPNPTYRVPRRGRRGGLDPAMRRLMIYAGGVVGVLAVIGGASLLFDRHTGPVPVVQADSRPMRVKPENPGGMQITGLGDDVGDDGKGKLAPAPETPNPKALRATAAQEAPAVPPAALTAPNAGVAPSPSPSPSAAATAPAQRVATAAAPKPAPAAPTTTAPAVSTPAAPVAATAPSPAPAPVAAPVARAAAKPVPATTGRAAVQLAALSSEEAAKVEWQRMEKRMPDLLGGHSPTYTKVERDGHVFWRVRVAGFGDLAQAKAFCERVRAKGAGCSVADF
ncbi:MAG: hypothetical protein BGO51_19690 [Rhodospirillales bacterium 69-11]|nr:MAG: hypothetical protein BGO51_19690 [Rhodospirillales bacterium 69-11]